MQSSGISEYADSLLAVCRNPAAQRQGSAESPLPPGQHCGDRRLSLFFSAQHDPGRFPHRSGPAGADRFQRHHTTPVNGPDVYYRVFISQMAPKTPAGYIHCMPDADVLRVDRLPHREALPNDIMAQWPPSTVHQLDENALADFLKGLSISLA